MDDILIVSGNNSKLLSEGLKIFLSDTGHYHSVTNKILDIKDPEFEIPAASSFIVLVLLDEKSKSILPYIDKALPVTIPFLLIDTQCDDHLPIKKKFALKRKVNIAPYDTSLDKLNDFIQHLTMDNDASVLNRPYLELDTI